MSRAQQDQFIDDDEEETCPLCVEEFDITDKGFRPCPCGYQICQFCYHNVKTNMNGLCPACRRPYNDSDIEYKVITPEEAAAHKARQAQKQKKTQAAQQKEKQKAEADNLSRKHLAGLRVVQKNLVYVTGLSPNFQEDKLLQTLRGDQYFGQYGKIIKIVVSKAKDTAHPQSVGVYVTYERKEDAATCIAAVDGSKNGERTLRAQFGTTKYCSAYLRGENCANRSCMFLHEPGEANESYSRADLSALNAGQHGPGRAPPPQSQQPMASASPSQPMARQSSSDRPQSPAVDRPALPSTASWASKPSHVVPSRTESRSTSGTVESPAPMSATLAPSQSDQSPAQEQPVPAQEPAPPEAPVQPAPIHQRPRRQREPSPLFMLLKHFNIDDLKFSFSPASIPESDLDIIDNYPPLFDTNGGAKRRLRRQREEEQRRMEQEAQAFQQPPSVDQDENPELGGSLVLGGEPEERQSRSQPTSAIQPPGPDGLLDQRFQFGGGIPSPGAGDRGLTQQQQLLLSQSMKGPNQGSYLNNFNQPSSFQQPSHPPGHHRNASRYSFANESSASTNVKPAANAKVLNQQSSIMPPAGSNHFGAQQQQHGNQFFTSNVQGPPPGLKATGTPPVSGGMTFGQGHGFATGGLQYGTNAPGRNANEELMRNLLRRDGAPDQAKHDAEFPPLGPPSRQQSVQLDEPRRSTPPVPPGFEAQAPSESRHSTPTVPPGLSKPTAVPDLEGTSGSRPASRASLKRTTSQITPALPLRPATPPRPATPSPAPASLKQEVKDEGKQGDVETPTRAPKASSATRNVGEGVAQQGGVEEPSAKPKVAPEVAQAADQSDTATSETKHKKPAADVKVETQVKQEQASSTPQKSAPKAMQPTGKGHATVQATETKAVPVTPTKPEATKVETQKRKAPGKLDIAAAVEKKEPIEPASSAPADSDAHAKDLRNVSQTQSATSKPESPSVGSPAVKAAPRTLRVLPTPKTEILPSATIATPKEATAPVSVPTAAVAKVPSRQPSVASINLPGTPSSEQVSISDNISITSASQSRASSPPPQAGSSKVGSAPVKPKTKNQLKKERRERAAANEAPKAEENEAAKAAVEETAQEAIVSRKKKAKKEKEPKAKNKAPAAIATGESTPTASRPASPQFKAVPEASPVVEQSTKATETSKPSTPISATYPVLPATQSPHEPSPPPTPTISPSQVLADIKANAPAEIQKCIDSLFRSPTSNHYKPSQDITAKDLVDPARWQPDFKLNLTKDEIEALLKGAPPAIHYGGEDGRMWSRGVITQSGAHLRALTKELELRVVELEQAIRDLPEELRFRPTKPQNETKFPSMDLEALKGSLENTGGRGVSIMEQMVQDGSTMKKGAFLVDEASKYINEFVMPPATPPSSAGGGNGRGQAGAGAQGPSGETVLPSVDIVQRQLDEARRVADEREQALRKMVKKNKKVLGLG